MRRLLTASLLSFALAWAAVPPLAAVPVRADAQSFGSGGDDR